MSAPYVYVRLLIPIYRTLAAHGGNSHARAGNIIFIYICVWLCIFSPSEMLYAPFNHSFRRAAITLDLRYRFLFTSIHNTRGAHINIADLRFWEIGLIGEYKSSLTWRIITHKTQTEFNLLLMEGKKLQTRDLDRYLCFVAAQGECENVRLLGAFMRWAFIWQRKIEILVLISR